MVNILLFILIFFNLILFLFIVFYIKRNTKKDKDFFIDLQNKFNEFQDKQRNLLLEFSNFVNNIGNKNFEQFTKLEEKIENRLKDIKEDYNNNMKEIKTVVESKLQESLEKKVGESFKLVNMRLEAVHRGLGEMQELARNVGDLKKIFSNIKNRGMWGEIQLEYLLNDFLTSEQFEKNVKIYPDKSFRVEFAIKLPDKFNERSFVYIPIDCKFPVEDYQKLINAREEGNIQSQNEYIKFLKRTLFLEAKSINEKYINPPITTDFAIMYLPSEGLFSEVMGFEGLSNELLRKYKVIVAGPTTFSALLNSLQVGFKSLAIEKRTTEVWELLSTIKSEFSKFSEKLEKIQKKLTEASNVVEDATKKTRTIEKKLKNVESLSHNLEYKK